ncbi:uncharacterized protein LOC105216282 [Zeugodacus cucurbitae]|uniref:uncharacterized protein LOC105216282 n=1 Tax=Zeugodacus cucurbitae TaxID=28588 RepID=UPI0005967C36|nr:uncharacterized protein LOC105216282 [Zeugodacus cucurbitae]
MRTVHESAYKPKLTGETKFVVNIRPKNQNGAALSSTNAAAIKNKNNATCGPLAANRTNADVIRLETGSAVGAGIPNTVGNGAARQNNSKDQQIGIAEMKWPRICSASALIVAVLLISGSIYLHLRQKPHLGRLHHESKTHAVQGVASTLGEYNSSIARPTPAAYRLFVPEPTAVISTKTSAATSTTSWSKAAATGNITAVCIQCLCETVNLCRPAKCRDDEECGVFRISRFYWLDAGKPTLDDDKSSSTSDADTMYTDCVNNMDCATRAVTAYMKKYARDCDGNGAIDCRDHIALHLLGPTGCVQSEGVLAPTFEQRMDDCLAD